VPTLGRKILENGGDLSTRFSGAAIGDGWMSPPQSADFAELLFQVQKGLKMVIYVVAFVVC